MSFNTKVIKRILWENKEVGRINQDALNAVSCATVCFLEEVSRTLLKEAEGSDIVRLDDYSIKQFAETHEQYRFLLDVYENFKEEEKHRITFKKRSSSKQNTVPEEKPQDTTKSAWDYEEEGFDDI